MTNEQIAERIRQARLERGLTQKDLAVFLNKTPSNVSDIERCRVQVSAVDLYILAEALNKPIEYFFGEDFGGKDIENLVGLIRNETPDAKKATLEWMHIWLNMQTLVQRLEVTDRELTTEELQLFVSNFVAFVMLFEEMKKQVDAQRAELVAGLKEQGIDLAAMLGGT